MTRAASQRRDAAWALLALGLALSNVACSKGGGAEADKAPDPQVEVRVAALEQHTFQDAITAPGTWKSAGEVPLRAPAAGLIETLTPRAGDVLAVGQTVGRIETRESRAAVEGAQALVREAGSASARADAGRALVLAQRERVHIALVAPSAGVVLDRSAEPGALVDDGAEILAIVPHGGRVFEAHVPAAQGGRVHVGQAAEIGATATDAVREGLRAATVRTILPTADSTDQSTLVWLAPTTMLPAPPLDRFETARILVGASRQAIAVPDSAIVEDDVTGEKRVAIAGADGRAVWTRVTLGAESGGWTEIQAPPLTTSTRVVVTGQRGLPDHARLTIGK